MSTDKLNGCAEVREMLVLTVNQLEYLQLKDCGTNSPYSLSFLSRRFEVKAPKPLSLPIK